MSAPTVPSTRSNARLRAPFKRTAPQDYTPPTPDTLPASSPPPSSPRKLTSSPRVSVKAAVIGAARAVGPSPLSRAVTRTAIEEIAERFEPGDLEVPRRASMPARYNVRDMHLATGLSRSLSPEPSAREAPTVRARSNSPTAVPTSPITFDAPLRRPPPPPPAASNAPTSVEPVQRAPSPSIVVPAPSAVPVSPPAVPPAPTAAPVSPPAGPLGHTANPPPPQFDPHTRMPQESARTVLERIPLDDLIRNELPPTYSEATRIPEDRTRRVACEMWPRLETLTFNLPAPLFNPIDEATFVRKGRRDYVEGRTIDDIGDWVFAYSRTWNASRCNLQIPRVDPSMRYVKCKVNTDSPYFESPTHILVLTTGVGNKMTFTHVPVHDLVYFAQCAGIRPGLFERSDPFRFREEDGTFSVILPVAVMQVPANHCFALLDDYFYHRNTTYFFQQLVSPLMPTIFERREFENNYQRCQFYVRLLLRHFNFLQITRRLLAIHNLHRNALRVGVVDPSFWRVVNIAWFCMGAALKGKKKEMLRLTETHAEGRGGVSGRSASMPEINHH